MVGMVLMALLTLIGVMELGRVVVAFISILDVEAASTEEDLERVSALNEGMFLLYATAFFSAVVTWCVWVGKSCKNAWFLEAQRGAEGGSNAVTPGWAVAYYFIPIMNLWKPMEAMAFIRDSVTRYGGTLGYTVGWWWFFLILSLVANRISIFVFTEGTTEDYIAALKLRMLLSPIYLTSLAMAFLLVQKMTRVQERLRKALVSGKALRA